MFCDISNVEDILKQKSLPTANDYRKKLNEKKTAFAQTVIAKERSSQSFVTY